MDHSFSSQITKIQVCEIRRILWYLFLNIAQDNLKQSIQPALIVGKKLGEMCINLSLFISFFSLNLYKLFFLNHNLLFLLNEYVLGLLL